MKHRGLETARTCVGLTVLLVEQKVMVSNSLKCSVDKVAHELPVSIIGSVKGSDEKFS